ncbi:MAG TPA: hypothetical protein VD965_02415 [Burkholderiales bacterium]|nr:hypothetical protein [Burkholderiales bacterium]
MLLLVAAPLAAHAQSFRCVGKDGKKYYGSAVPPQCAGVVVEQLNASGQVIKRIDPAADGKAAEEKAAAEAKKRQDEAAAKDLARRRNALLATYASEKDIDDARARALADNAKAAKDIETRIEAAKKGKGGDVKTLEGMLDAKRKEATAINAKFDQEKKQYVELTKK